MAVSVAAKQIRVPCVTFLVLNKIPMASALHLPFQIRPCFFLCRSLGSLIEEKKSKTYALLRGHCVRAVIVLCQARLMLCRCRFWDSETQELSFFTWTRKQPKFAPFWKGGDFCGSVLLDRGLSAILWARSVGAPFPRRHGRPWSQRRWTFRASILRAWKSSRRYIHPEFWKSNFILWGSPFLYSSVELHLAFIYSQFSRMNRSYFFLSRMLYLPELRLPASRLEVWLSLHE